jgi:hypothetical protein
MSALGFGHSRNLVGHQPRLAVKDWLRFSDGGAESESEKRIAD